jgi:SRSO17 transposase
MAPIADLSGDTLLRMLNKEVTLAEKCHVANRFFNYKKVYLVVDDVLIEKMYSTVIEGSSDHYDASSHTYYRSLCSVAIMFTDGYYSIPVAHQLWINKEIMGDEYQKKQEIALALIKSIKTFCKIKIVIADALYATVEFMKGLIQLDLRFEMKIHANRKVQLKTGEMALIRDIFKGRMKKRECRTMQITWNKLSLHITACKRYIKRGDCKIIYQVSNFATAASEHVRVYKYRWQIEKFFRTAKQSLGLKDCQSRSATRQTNHINNVFIAYIILQLERKKYRLKTPESALKRLKTQDCKQLLAYLSAPNQIFAVNFA